MKPQSNVRLGYNQKAAPARTEAAHSPNLDERSELMTTVLDRLLRDVSKPDGEEGCWLWTGKSKTQAGYGMLKWQGRQVYAHRVAYEACVGPIPAGWVIDHLCRTPSCCNPTHLEAVTYSENTLRAPVHLWRTNAAKTHCVNGHEFTPENTYNRPGRRRVSDGQPVRDCKACKREAVRRSVARRKARRMQGGDA